VTLPFLGSTRIVHYRDDGRHGSAFVDVRLYRDARLSLGGSLSVSTGSRPTRYYQPRARLLAPLASSVSWTAEWRWFGFVEKVLRYDNFRTHAFSIGLQLGL